MSLVKSSWLISSSSLLDKQMSPAPSSHLFPSLILPMEGKQQGLQPSATFLNGHQLGSSGNILAGNVPDTLNATILEQDSSMGFLTPSLTGISGNSRQSRKRRPFLANKEKNSRM